MTRDDGIRILALQSGTSADAIDVALVDAGIAEDGAAWIAPVLLDEEAWPPAVRERILAAADGACLDALAWTMLETSVGRALGDVAARLVAEHGPVDLVVSPGQTVHHWVDASGTRATLAVGDPAWIAEAAGAPVLSHLRHADIAAGGHGAPLAVVLDALWLAGLARERGAVAGVNLGGIANVQVVHADGSTLAFDTGPASCLLDAAVQRATGAAFDADGALATAGVVDEGVLARLLAHPYLARPAPKTTGRETFSIGIVDDAGGSALALPDLAATLVECTARSLVDAVVAVPDPPALLVVSGGGVRNPALMARIRALASERGMEVRTSDALGMPADAKESVLFALLGLLTWHGVPVSLGGPTRVAGRLTLGREAVSLPPAASPPTRLVLR